MTVSHVARLHDVNANQLFKWRKQFQEGSLTAISADEDVVPASELAAALRQIRELQRLLGKKTMENEILKEAVEYGRVHIPVENEHLFRFKMNADSGLRVHHFRTPQSTNSDVR